MIDSETDVVWRTLPSNSGYRISSSGLVMNASSGLILTPWVHKSGHLYLKLGRGKSYQVHHLVLSAFSVFRPDGYECRHLDGNPSNNDINNLVWGTRKENIEDLKSTIGRYAKAVLTDSLATKIFNSYTGKHGQQSMLAREHGVSLSVVNDLVHGKTYAHLRH